MPNPQNRIGGDAPAAPDELVLLTPRVIGQTIAHTVGDQLLDQLAATAFYETNNGRKVSKDWFSLTEDERELWRRMARAVAHQVAGVCATIVDVRRYDEEGDPARAIRERFKL